MKLDSRRDGGFTLLELLIVLTVAALMVTVVIPWGRMALVRFQADGATEDVVAAIGEARDLAIRRNHIVKLYVDERAPSVEVEGGHYRRLPAAVRLSGPPRGYDGKGIILFHPDGTSDGGQVVVDIGDFAWAISVEELTGQPRRVHAAAR